MYSNGPAGKPISAVSIKHVATALVAVASVGWFFRCHNHGFGRHSSSRVRSATTTTRSGRDETPEPRVQNATVAWDVERIRVSSTGPSSTLPYFFFMSANVEGGSLYTGYNFTGGRGQPDLWNARTSCPDDVFENTMEDMRAPQLPWRLQEDWGCEREDQNVSVLVLENEYLRAAITPQWGGKIWSLFDKKNQRHMFFNNPAHQPANIGIRKAWTSGGCEWNWSPGPVGHSVFTESPVWTAVLDTEYGPLVRVWEYDRQNSTIWQVDMLLYRDTLLVHPKITNPTSLDVKGYWWTCVAMRVDGPRNRILTPATISIDNGGQCTPWPWGDFTLRNTSFRGPDVHGNNCLEENTCAWQSDLSFLGNIPDSNDFFFHIAKNQTPWIAHVQEDGYTVVHSHPEFLNGTKFFQWGWNEHGTWNQDFLSATDTTCLVDGVESDVYDPNCMSDHPGRYTELQIGPARTQMHTFPLPKKSALEWTEWFKGYQADRAVTQHPNYQVALESVTEWWTSRKGISETVLEKMDDILRAMADVPPTPEQIISRGMPWGGLRQKLEKTLSETGFVESSAPGCPFPEPEADTETTPWLELLETGTFSDRTLSLTPVNFEISDEWVHVLQGAVDSGKGTWLHFLFLGTHSLEAGNAKLGAELLEASMLLKPSVHAARNLAIMAPTQDEAIKLYKQAWKLWGELDPNTDSNVAQLGADLAGEFCGWLLGNERWTELELFLDSLRSSTPLVQTFLGKDRVLHGLAGVAVHIEDFDTAISILRGNCFPTYGSLRRNLLALWWDAQKGRAVTQRGGAALSIRELLALRRRLRCDGDESQRGVDDPCICGPPNLGYQY